MLGIANGSSLPGSELLVHVIAEVKVQWKKRGGPVLDGGGVGLRGTGR